ncbi:hypothetical protein DOTSEDRAFT_92135 [Dothistroma septosporum NZE10]|uniref:AB hydrolase-1 domain-containing protein n=1 Tax=Dothistroma septosporum (strain NZE10 / CBS 128990) TaxID=675120 RepID=M2YIX5_DOTSN|nr:hypothetical protein DOTSEDRAFT_92135 [Dothistroma septosporum NZE10]
MCIEGIFPVQASADNHLIKLDEPANQTVLTELVVEILQVNSTRAEELDGGINKVSGTYGIYSQMCFPARATNTSTVQFLIHGAGFDRSYWDAAPGYSYVDYAAERGYPAFLFDRLGVGLSDHPDPIQIVQISIQVAINHELIRMLRDSSFAGHAFDRVVGVGHSYGSANLVGVATAYPSDFDALVLTGFSSSLAGIPIATATFGLSIASQSQPTRFVGLSNGYVTSASVASLQGFFFRAPGFDPALLNLAENTKQTTSLGEQLLFGKPRPAANFTGPIDVVNGLNDLPNCFGNCLYPENLAAGVKDALFPATRNVSFYLASDTGHGMNFHYSATDAYKHIHDNLAANGY